MDLPCDVLTHMLEGVADRREWKALNGLLRVLRTLQRHYYCQEDGSDHYLRQLQLRCTDATGHSLLDGRCFLGIADKPDPMTCLGWSICEYLHDRISSHYIKGEHCLHRVGGPAKITTNLISEKIYCKEWRDHGDYHRDNVDKPALITYSHVTGKKIRKMWWKHGVALRMDLLVNNQWQSYTLDYTNEWIFCN